MYGLVRRYIKTGIAFLFAGLLLGGMSEEAAAVLGRVRLGGGGQVGVGGRRA